MKDACSPRPQQWYPPFVSFGQAQVVLVLGLGFGLFDDADDADWYASEKQTQVHRAVASCHALPLSHPRLLAPDDLPVPTF